MWAQNEEKEFWLNWLNHYKSLRCLWDEDEKRKAGRAGRQAAYQELADLAKDVYAKADIQFVRRRISTFRTGYRREMHRVEAAKKKNDCNYEPQLFYYKTLDFLNDSPDVFGSKNNSEDEEKNEPSSTPKKTRTVHKLTKSAKTEKNLSYCSNNNVSIDNIMNIEVNDMPPSKITKTSLDYDDFESNRSMEFVSIAQLERENDEYEILGKRIAAHFRNMTLNQRLIAEKIITDVCIYGRMEKLTLDSNIYVNETEKVVEHQSNTFKKQQKSSF